MNTVSRRHFLKFSASAGLAVAGAPLLQPATALAIEPFKRAGKPRLQLSLAAYSFREFFKDASKSQKKGAAAARQIDLFDFIDFCAGHGCEGTELTSYYFPKDVTAGYLIKIKRHAFLHGIAVSGTAIGNNFSLPKGPKLNEEIVKTKQWIDRAALLGAPHIRVFAGQAKEISREEADQQVIVALEECCEYAGTKGIFLGLENHDSIGNADALLALIKAVKSPWLGVNLDSGNFRTEDPYQDFARCVPYAVNVQMKTEVGRKSAQGGEPADLKRIAQLLRDGGYQGWVALEYEGKEDPWVAVPRTLKQMKELFTA